MIFSHYNIHPRPIKKPSAKWRRRLSGVFIIVLTVVYIGLTNDVAVQGYRLKSLQEEVKKLEEENSALAIQVAAAQSLQRLESESTSLALTPLDHIEYFATPTTAVAAR